MSRSYKKHPIVKESARRVSHRFKGKTLASRAVRRNEIPNGKSGYKKVYCSWNVHEYAFYESEYEVRKEWDSKDSYLHKHYKTYKQALQDWKKNYKRK